MELVVLGSALRDRLQAVDMFRGMGGTDESDEFARGLLLGGRHGLINLAYVGAVSPGVGMVVLGAGLLQNI